MTLRGEVDWQFQRTNIHKNIEHVGGVIGVFDMITLKLQTTATDIQVRIKEALNRHADVEAAKIKVTVTNGTVTLDGDVDSIEEMDRVENAAWAALGVHRIVDNLRVA